jgi:hypothetical protein
MTNVVHTIYFLYAINNGYNLIAGNFCFCLLKNNVDAPVRKRRVGSDRAWTRAISRIFPTTMGLLGIRGESGKNLRSGIKKWRLIGISPLYFAGNREDGPDRIGSM